MSMMRTMGLEPDEWDETLSDVQRLINSSESKVTCRTPFELLHGYRPRFHLGKLRGLSKIVDNWTPPDQLRDEARRLMEGNRGRVKAAYDNHRHNNIHYTVGEVVVMKRAPVPTGESVKLQDKYRGPLVVTEVLPSDVYRVAELNPAGKSRFATTAHVAQLKSWALEDAEGGEDTSGVGEEAPGTDRTESESPAELPELTGNRRQRRPPVWAADYVSK